MKMTYMIGILLVFAWPLYYLYELQLGAVSFLLLAIFFLVVSVKETKKLRLNKEMNPERQKRQKIKRNNR
ncbi:hypothetical protein E2K98_03520 [Bacillus salipaludis]|uniref:Uncharacterized protein n=1 Tax=Bacillus salipaludis TaxID=2547811 RepID=A0A4R5VZE5_9BACI|nr:hypothetical protein [Bacillus salipaludis]MDQ6595200.1 hypothetical protein [Bacillus salipaludis]TDK63947.1 hypothetical protein E2K98_03520 [Bacillus salipaludis]